MKRESGFTFIEAIVVAAVFAIVIVVMVPHMDTGFEVWRSTDDTIARVQSARITFDKMLRDIRNSNGIIAMASDSITVVGDDGNTHRYGTFDSDGETYIGYSLNGGDWETLVGSVDSFNLTYYDNTGNITDQTDEVQSVNVSFSTGDESFSSRVYIAIREGFTSEGAGGGAQFTPWGITAGTGGVSISGSVSVTGTYGSVRSIGDVTISGSGYVQGDVRSSGEITLHGSCVVGGETISHDDPFTFPDIDPDAWATERVYKLMSDGRVYDPDDNLVGDGSYGPWRLTGNKWKISGHSSIDGVFYSQLMVQISGSFSGNVTIISPRKIKISGGGFTTATDTGILFLSGDDVEISGSVVCNGLVVGKNIKASGSTQVIGAIVGNYVRISGSASIICNGEYGIGDGGSDARITILNWNEQ